MKLLLKWFICALAVALAILSFPQAAHAASGLSFLAAATVLWLLNLILRPIVQLACLPATMLTFGLFFFIVNVWMVGLTDAMLPVVSFDGFWIKLFISLIVSAGNTAVMALRRARQ